MFRVFVNYSDNLKKSYQAILKDLYGRSLKPFYDGDLPQEKLEKVLETKEMQNLGVSYHSFLTNYFFGSNYVWRKYSNFPFHPAIEFFISIIPFGIMPKGLLYCHQVDVELSDQVLF